MTTFREILSYRVLITLLSLPVVLGEYFKAETGREYSLGFSKKLILILKMALNNIRVRTESTFVEHLMMTTRLLHVPRSLPGCVVECGTFEGGSAVNLGLVCALTGRKLELFDSFAGLPEPPEADQRHVLIDRGEVHAYVKGAYVGTLEKVKSNLARCGVTQLCSTHVGYFDESLPRFSQPAVLIFLDVDLVESSKTCLRYLWPLLQDGCCLFTHEAHHLEIARLYFDRDWWQEELSTQAPGLFGAGTGLGLHAQAGGYKSSLGYTIKNPDFSRLARVPQGLGSQK